MYELNIKDIQDEDYIKNKLFINDKNKDDEFKIFIQ